jgi:biopolymer transport protein ExbD
MKLRRRTRRASPEPTLGLINVSFFLLVFFMLIGRMDATAPFALLPPTGASGTDMPAGGATLSIAADGRLAFDGEEIAATAIAPAIVPRLADNPALMIRINADRTAPLRLVLPLIAQLEGLGAQNVVLVVAEAP